MRNRFRRLGLASISLPVLASLVACGSSGDDRSVADLSGFEQADVSVGDVQNDDSESNGADIQCDAGNFDQAELLFTETDRQWYCSVLSTELASSDEVYFSRKGTAIFTRFGEVYWNRNLPAEQLNIASPFVTPFVMKEITSSNTTLQFAITSEGGKDQQYDCVLVQRSDIS